MPSSWRPPRLRSGAVPDLEAWLGIKGARFAKRRSRYARLSGEILSIWRAPDDDAPLDELNVRNMRIEGGEGGGGTRGFLIRKAGRAYHCVAASAEEGGVWVEELERASRRCFEKRYVLGKKLAESAATRVHLCVTVERPRRTFAVKVVRKLGMSAANLERARRERVACARLDHVNVVQVVDVFCTVQEDFIVMEYMRGVTLEEFLYRHAPLSESYARAIMRQLVRAVAHMHERGVVHRDLRPEKILCSGERFPMSIAVADFGNSNFVRGDRVNKDVLGTFTGTPPYICVDVCKTGTYGPPVDMWSVGVILFEMLSGQSPFAGTSNRRMISNIKKGNYSFRSSVWKEVSPEAKCLIRQLLQPDSYKRLSALAAIEHNWMNQRTVGRSSRRSKPQTPRFPKYSGASTEDEQVATKQASREEPGGTSARAGKTSLRRSQSTGSTLQSIGIGSGLMPHLDTDSSALPRNSSSPYISSLTRSMPRSSSLPSASDEKRRMPLTPSVREISRRGLHNVARENPGKINHLLGSKVVQKQLSMTLPYRRRLVVIARAFIAIFRMQSLVRGHCMTKNLPLVRDEDFEYINDIAQLRKIATRKSFERQRREFDGTTLGRSGSFESTSKGRGGRRSGESPARTVSRQKSDHATIREVGPVPDMRRSRSARAIADKQGNGGVRERRVTNERNERDERRHAKRRSKHRHSTRKRDGSPRRDETELHQRKESRRRRKKAAS